MAIQPTYPGVYVEELPSEVRTITGVSTSITAFIGRALLGPTDEPKRISSFGEFQRVFGGLWDRSSLGFAVRDFYANDGSEAVVVRLYRKKGTEPSSATLALATDGGEVLSLKARSEGAWGNNLRARVEYPPSAMGQDAAKNLGMDVAKADRLFHLLVHDARIGATELFQNVTVAEGPRRVDRVLDSESSLVRVETLPSQPADPNEPPPRPKEHDPASPQDMWADPPQGQEPTTYAKVADSSRASDGDSLIDADFIGDGKEANKEGLFALERTDLFNLLCIPPYLDPPNDDGLDVSREVIGIAAGYCENKRRAMLLVDPPRKWVFVEDAVGKPDDSETGVSGVGTRSKNAALFFPRLRQPNPLRDNHEEDFVPCGAVAGVFARTDRERGVFKAPAGLEARLKNVRALSVSLTDPENGQLNPLGVNCLRTMRAVGPVVWGARTLQGDDRLASQWKYVPVRRLALYIEESLYRGTHWVVFEPNDEPLWAQIRLNVGAFMHNLFRQGAFQGTTPRRAYFVKCDGETTTQNDIDLGIVNIVVGFAPLKPAEFVIIKIQQIAGDIQT